MTAQRTTVVNTADMTADLALIRSETGGTAADAVREALAMYAHALRFTRDYQEVPDGTPLRVTGYVVNGTAVSTVP
jgi:hypothetical protein